MRKQVIVGGSLKDAAARVADAWRHAERGEKVETEDNITFVSWSALASRLSDKRYELLRHLHRRLAVSIRALARELGRDFKRVHEDVTALEAIGLIGGMEPRFAPTMTRFEPQSSSTRRPHEAGLRMGGAPAAPANLQADLGEADYAKSARGRRACGRHDLAASPCLSAAALVAVIADREGEIYELFARLPDAKTHVLVRAAHDRALDAAGERLLAKIAAEPEAGRLIVSVPSRPNGARGDALGALLPGCAAPAGARRRPARHLARSP